MRDDVDVRLIDYWLEQVSACDKRRNKKEKSSQEIKEADSLYEMSERVYERELV